MFAAMRPGPRTQPAKPPLSRDAVLEAGLRVLRARGIDGVTMRAVAAELETGAASLYVYFPNRKALLDAMFDEVAGGIDVSDTPDPARWREQLTALLTRAVEVMDAHPGIARVPLANPPTGLFGTVQSSAAGSNSSFAQALTGATQPGTSSGPQVSILAWDQTQAEAWWQAHAVMTPLAPLSRLPQ